MPHMGHSRKLLVLANDVAWFKSGGFKPQAPTLPSVPRHECRSIKGVASRPCDEFLLVLAMRARGAPSTKTYGNN